MSNEVNKQFNRIYSFLATFEGKDGWKTTADGMGVADGVVTINEFRKLIDSEWDIAALGNVPENDIINNFFRKFDTNHSGANKDRIPTGNGSVSNMYAWSGGEQIGLDNDVAKFVAINEALDCDSIKKTINDLLKNIDNGAEQSECRGSIISYLNDELIELNITDVDILRKNAETLLKSNQDLNKRIAVHIGDDLKIEASKNELVSGLGKFYDIFQDKDLQSIINSAVNGSINIDNVKVNAEGKIYAGLCGSIKSSQKSKSIVL